MGSSQIQIPKPNQSMKTKLILAAVVAAAVVIPSATFAAKGATGKAPKTTDKKGEEPAAKFDTNHNGKIDKGPEADALRKAFDADKTGPLKKYDLNHNGNLEDSEIAAIHITYKSK
jgi:hypothetical protein